MRKIFFILCLLFSYSISIAQSGIKSDIVNGFITVKNLKTTMVKSQNKSDACWCFSTTSLVESQCLKNNLCEFDISEMYIVRNIYIEKAKNYILRNGKTQFGPGGLGHDLIQGIANYGAIPEDLYTGLSEGSSSFDHRILIKSLKNYLDSILIKTPLSKDWLTGFINILNETIPVPPSEFQYKGKKYTPLSFAKDVLKFSSDDYVNITSFTHQPFYKPFVLQVPDNFSNGYYYNLPLSDMLKLVKDALTKDYSIMWDADISNPWFRKDLGIAIYPKGNPNLEDIKSVNIEDIEEENWNEIIRQELYENLETQDDHLMHITGLSKSKNGKTFFIVKNSWGQIGPFDGYLRVSEAYFAINTLSLVLPKAALSKTLLKKLQLN